MSFWETVRGVMLAETLIEYLPNIAKEKKQEIAIYSNPEILKTEISKKFKKGFLVHSITKSESEFIVIFEK